MRKLLNTLFVTRENAYLAKQGLSVLVNVDGETLLRTPIHLLDGIVCFGNVGCSPHLLGHCADNNVSVSFLSDYGRFRARVQGPVSGNVLLRRSQYRFADDEDKSAEIARCILTGKIANSRAVLQRSIRDHSDIEGIEDIKKAVDSLTYSIRKLEKPWSLDELRGIEGDAAHVYFGVFDHLIRAMKECFHFECRNRRPPTDPINALLSFFYTLLVHDVCSALEGVGLDPAVGYLHRDRPGRPSLALDMMEEFRSGLADRLALTLINRRQIDEHGFNKSKAGSVMMDDETRKQVLVAWQKRKQEIITHSFLNEKMPIGLLFHVQARLMAKHLRGELDGYPPFFWK